MQDPIFIGETVTPYYGQPLTANGSWGTQGQGAHDAINAPEFDDFLAHGNDPSYTGDQKAIQQFWAKGFNRPSDLSYPTLDPVFSLPPQTLPLPINDQLSVSRSGTWGSLDNRYTIPYVEINGDGGNAPNKYHIYFGGAFSSGLQSCGSN